MNNDSERIRTIIDNLRNEIAIEAVKDMFDEMLKGLYDTLKSLLGIKSAVADMCDEIADASGVDEAIKLRAVEVGVKVKRQILYIGERLGSIAESIPVDFQTSPNGCECEKE